MDLLRLAVGWVAVAVVTLLGFSVLLLVYRGKIDLKYLIGDVNGDASMSRFQLLIFTFVIALSFLYLVTSPEAKGFPEVPANVLILLGISGSSYLVSKGIDRPNGADKPADKPDLVRSASGPSTS